MKITNKTIVITDPCYIALDKDWDENGAFNYGEYKITDNHFTDYIWQSTGFGDGSFAVNQTNKILSQGELEKHIDDLLKTTRAFIESPTSVDRQISYENLVRQSKNVGRFCVDSGTFGVFILDEVLSYNPNFLSDYGDWCFAIIEDFTGNIETYFTEEINDEDNSSSYPENHIIGMGNKTIFSVC